MRGGGGEMLEGPWGSGAREEGLLLAWPSWLIWTSKPRVCSEELLLLLPQRETDVPLMVRQEERMLYREGGRGGQGEKESLPVATPLPVASPGNGKDHTVSHSPSPVPWEANPPLGPSSVQGMGRGPEGRV